MNVVETQGIRHKVAFIIRQASLLRSLSSQEDYFFFLVYLAFVVFGHNRFNCSFADLRYGCHYEADDG